MNALLVPIVMIMFGLLIGVFLKTFEKYIKLPYTVSLFVIGLILGIAYKVGFFESFETMKDGVNLIQSMNPDFVLYVFLPILIFDSAYKMDLHVFKRTLVNSSILAGPGLVICMLLTAGLIQGLSYVLGTYNPDNWKFALMFGGLISATDPVAVVALLNELKTSKRFSTLVDGESLLNDGTGIVCFMMFYSQFNGMGTIDHPVLFFVWVCVISFIVGYVISQLTILFLTKVCQQEVVQNCVMVIAAYLTFMIAQSILEVSGVIALVVYGHFFAQKALPHLKEDVATFMGKFWGFLSEVANTLLFLIVGIVIATKVNVTWTLIFEVILVYVGLNIIRYIMILVLYPLIKRIGYGLKPTEAIVLGWGGLRGALGMSMALMVHYNTQIPEHIRDGVLLLTAGVVALTLCINGTTAKLLVDKFKMTKILSPFEHRLRKGLVSKFRDHDMQTISSMKKDEGFVSVNWSNVEEKIISEYKLPEGVENAITSKEEMLSFGRKLILEREKTVAYNLYNIGIITLESYKTIIDVVDFLQDFDGNKPLDALNLKMIQPRIKWFHSKKKRITSLLNACRAYSLVLDGCMSAIIRIEKSRVNNGEDMADSIAIVRGELDHLRSFVNNIILGFAKKEPEIFANTLTNRAVRMMLASERELLEQMVSEGVVDKSDAENLGSNINKRQGLEIVG